MIFTSPMLNLYAGVINNTFFGASCALTIFPGAQPSGSAIAASWPTYSALYLQHWRTAGYTQPNANTYGAGNYVSATTLPSISAAYRSGTATWGILWASDITEATIQGASLPATRYIIVPVTDISGTGVIKLSSTTITALATSQPSSITIALNFL